MTLEFQKEMEDRDPELYISKLAEEKMRNHSIAHAAERREVMGLMLGGSTGMRTTSIQSSEMW